MKKKLLAAVMACAVVFSLSATAFAHHDSANCTYSGCTQSGTHYHDGTCYNGTGSHSGGQHRGRHH